MVPVVPADPEEGGRKPEEGSVPNKGGIRPPVVLRARLHYGSPMFGYSLAFSLITVTGVFRLALVDRGYREFPFVFFYPAIAIASFLGGVGPGLASIVLSAVFVASLFPFSLAPPSWIALAALGPLLAQGFAHLRHLHERSRAVARELANFKFIGDHASDWILLLDETRHIRYVNLKAAADLGWTDHELTGRTIESLIPATAEAERRALNTALEQARSGAARPIELAFERRDKSPLLVELGCTMVQTGDDRVIYVSARDIAERKELERRLQEIRHWESLEVLAGGLAHDFNNLLTSILGSASLAKDILPPDHETAALLDGVISAGASSSDLVRLMLATSGYRSQVSERLQLDRLLDGTLANRRLPPNIRVVKEVVKAATPFMGDRPSFETLFWSLISNAAESYGQKDGEVRVAIRSGPAPASRRASFEEGDPGDGECLGIVVEDRGSGMPPEILKRAFDPFFSTRFTGRGLGLPAVRGIVRAYSGKLLVETAVGQGTRVEVWLPVSRS